MALEIVIMSMLKKRSQSKLGRMIRRLLQQHRAKTSRMQPERRPRWWQAPVFTPLPAH